jgi:hypothetical protein
MLSDILEKFVQDSPITVMAQTLMSKIFAPDNIDHLFEKYAQRQYQQDLLFSSLVDLMSTVVCGIHPSVNAAYRKKAEQLAVSTTALYNKLQGVEIEVCQGLLTETSTQLQELIVEMGDFPISILPGYQIRIVDGSCLASTEHRLKPTREIKAAPLPGKAIVVFDPNWKLVLDILCEEDGYTQERALLPLLLSKIKPRELWIADRNFCTAEFLTSIDYQKAFFLIREHKSLPYKPLSELKPTGEIKTGKLFSQMISISFGVKVVHCRRVVLKLYQPTRDGEEEICILTNLPPEISDAKIAEIYQRRWNIETLFQTVTENFNGEIKTLAYPKAALFSYSLALVTYNILATIKYILSVVHGWGKIESGISDYYLVDEIQSTYRGMMIAVSKEDWQSINKLELSSLVEWLKYLANHVYLKSFRKTPRGVKKPKKPLIADHKRPHLSTARLLREN